MNQLWIVLKQEYLNRIRKRSFIVLTLLGPIISLCMLFVPLYLSIHTEERIHVWLQTETAETHTNIYSDEFFIMHQIGDTDAVVIHQHFLETSEDADVFSRISVKDKTISIWDKKGLKMREQWQLKKKLEQIYREDALMLLSPSEAILPKMAVVSLAPTENNSDAMQLTGIFAALIIYFFIFYYGVQVMKGIVDEKSNRVVEVVLCSVKPFYWMLGKIGGIAAVCLTQFSIWFVVYLWIWNSFSNRYGLVLQQFSDSNIQESMMHTKDSWQALEWNAVVQSMNNLPLTLLLISFFVYFLLGYLLYASLFAAVGAMTDNETDTQQFTFPITVPLFMTFLFSAFIIGEPYSNVSVFLSYFPLTSPVAMMLRIPLGIDLWEIVLSLSILLVTFVTAVYFASQIFKRGILQYGKTLQWKDIFFR